MAGRAPQGGATGSPEGRSVAFPLAAAIRRGGLHTRKMVPAVQERDSAQGSPPLSPSVSPQSYKSQSLLTQL